MRGICKSLVVAVSLLLCVGFFSQARAASGDVTVFAAASATNALTDIAKLYEASGHGKATFSFASSSTLAKQIEQGAPADVFLSADSQWMDYLEKKDMLEPGTRGNLLGNSIVLIVPANSKVGKVAISPKLDLAALLGKDGLLAVGDPAHVPVGIYAKEALERLNLWPQVEKRLAPAKDVRSGLALVERGESPLGIVYATDAGISERVHVVGVFPSDSHPPIVYPVGVVKKAKRDAGVAFIAFLRTTAAKEVWVKYGFTVN